MPRRVAQILEEVVADHVLCGSQHLPARTPTMRIECIDRHFDVVGIALRRPGGSRGSKTPIGIDQTYPGRHEAPVVHRDAAEVLQKCRFTVRPSDRLVRAGQGLVEPGELPADLRMLRSGRIAWGGSGGAHHASTSFETMSSKVCG